MEERTEFLKRIKQKYTEADAFTIERALEFAARAHEGQKRASGEPYITHPISAAQTLAEMNLDPQTIEAALLHDVVDDTPITLADVEKEFGKEVAFLVDGVSKLGKVRFPKDKVNIQPIETRLEEPLNPQMENLRKMFVAMAKDLRVTFIKFADRLHNMKTLHFLPEDKQKRIALETLEVYAPLAYRLGMWEMRGQLEDLAFPYIYPKEYYWLLLNVEERYEERKKYLDRIQPSIENLLKKEGIIPVAINSRAKHYWSLYRKLLKYQMNFDQIHDLVALRVILSSVEDCYKALGVLHRAWKPLPGKIKDYIALPKPNGYQSLHTTVLCEGGKITEFQLRTQKMHEEAEFGAAAHWAYKDRVEKGRKSYNWIKELSQWQKQVAGTREFFESLKIDFFKDRIFVFTPKGDIVDLPEDATPVDFAYSIHSDLGNRCVGAKINGRMASLDTPLKNGDQIEIIVAKNRHPNRDWLEFVKTNVARSHIKKWIKSANQDQSLLDGKKILDKEFNQLKIPSWDALSTEKKRDLAQRLGFSSPESVLAAVGNADVTPKEVVRHLIREEEVFKKAPPRLVPRVKEIPQDISIGGEANLLFHIAKCCAPKPPDPIVAFITKTHGASVHKETCDHIAERKRNAAEKVVEASWHTAPKCYIASIRVLCNDRIGLLRDIAACCSLLGINILGTKAQGATEKFSARVDVTVEVPNVEKLETLLDRLEDISGVICAERV